MSNHSRCPQASPRLNGSRVAAVILCVIVAMAVPRICRAQAVDLDSLIAKLNAPVWTTRSEALSDIREMQAPLPAALNAAIVALVKREAKTPEAGAGSEDFGEYVIDLVLASVKTGDKSTIPAIVALGGLEISSGIGAFIASGGPSVFPLLDSVQRASPLEGADVLDVVAFMYKQQGALLGPGDSVAILSRLLAAASSPSVTARMELPYLAFRLPLPDFVPLIRVLATSDTATGPPNVYAVRNSARDALNKLSSAWYALTPEALLDALARERTAACFSASGALYGHCQSMRADLDNVAAAVKRGEFDTAKAQLESFGHAAEQAVRAGLPSILGTLLHANAARLGVLLQ